MGLDIISNQTQTPMDSTKRKRTLSQCLANAAIEHFIFLTRQAKQKKEQ